MGVKFICDGCGKEEPADFNTERSPIKPREWYARFDGDGAQYACSRRCIEKVAAKTGKTNVVLPI